MTAETLFNEYVILFNKFERNIDKIAQYFINILPQLKNNDTQARVSADNNIHILTYYIPSILWFKSTIRILEKLNTYDFRDDELMTNLKIISKFIDNYNQPDELVFSGYKTTEPLIKTIKQLTHKYKKYCSTNYTHQSKYECSIVLLMMLACGIIAENKNDVLIFLKTIKSTPSKLNPACKNILNFITSGGIVIKNINARVFNPVPQNIQHTHKITPENIIIEDEITPEEFAEEVSN